MKGHGAKFGRKKELAIAALLTHRSVEDAARAVDLNHNTLLKWLTIPAFVKEYRAARPGSCESISGTAAAGHRCGWHGNAQANGGPQRTRGCEAQGGRVRV